MNSVISEMPGPEVAVNARAPFQPAPIDHADRGELVLGLDDGEAVLAGRRVDAELLQYLMNASASDDDGVIGYHAQTVAPP